VRILLDTNVIVDVALERLPHFEASQQVLLLVVQGEIEGYISASTFSDIYYIVRRGRGREWTRDFLTWLVTYSQIATVNHAAIEMALNVDVTDWRMLFSILLL